MNWGKNIMALVNMARELLFWALFLPGCFHVLNSFIVSEDYNLNNSLPTIINLVPIFKLEYFLWNNL